ncbi:MAG: hypothetical protein ACLFSL_03820, partial [Candidatus Woesearchaeota archaeon]
NINISMLRMDIISQVDTFMEEIRTGFKEIRKSNDYDDIKTFFQENERDLAKSARNPERYSNIPEDDDCSILAALRDLSTDKEKLLISADEHFWGYDDIILYTHNIKIVKESNCHTI